MFHGFAQCGLGLWGVLCWLLILGAGALVVYEAARFGAANALNTGRADGAAKNGPTAEEAPGDE